MPLHPATRAVVTFVAASWMSVACAPAAPPAEEDRRVTTEGDVPDRPPAS